MKFLGESRGGLAIMAHNCEVCGKKRMLGNSVSHANNKNVREYRPNLFEVRARVGGGTRRLRVCTRCLRSGLVEKA